MDNALEHGHLEGEAVDNVGQDEVVNTQESSTNWEDQAKYFQSEKDKLAAENSKLKQYEKIGQLLESRPDITNAVASMVQGGGQPQAPDVPKTDAESMWESITKAGSRTNVL